MLLPSALVEITPADQVGGLQEAALKLQGREGMKGEKREEKRAKQINPQ